MPSSVAGDANRAHSPVFGRVLGSPRAAFLTTTVCVGLLSAGFLIMGFYRMALSVLAPLAFFPSGEAAQARWHAPKRTQVNELDKVLTSEGVYGFIYDTSLTPDANYGTYNWCNMPHVRKEEYVKPSDEYHLTYVELVSRAMDLLYAFETPLLTGERCYQIHRHHKRTPYASNSFPVESYPWDCGDQALHYFGEPFQGPDAARAYRQGYISTTNPFEASGWTGTCQFPQITSEGLTDSWQHGADLYGVYGELLGFLPSRDDASLESKVVYHVTNNVITHQVAGMIVNAMWDTTELFPLHVQVGTTRGCSMLARWQ